MKLSHDVKESIKTALAMTIAYGVGLQMGWDRPYWAGFAVAFVSLATVGQSMNKATLRMVGTMVGAIVALTLLGLFAQQRWLFMIFLSLWLAVCTYMNTGNRHQYFWFVAGFVTVIIAADGGTTSSSAFGTAMLRLQQTGLGILAYSLVAIFLWPLNSKKDLEATARGQVATQRKLFSVSMQLLEQTGDNATIKSLHSEEITGSARLAVLLDAATTDSEEVHEREQAWRNFQQATGELAETMQRWRESFAELQTLPLKQLLPGLDDFALELDRRFTGMASMMEGQQAKQQDCAEIALEFNRAALEAQSHFHHAALLVAQRHMLRIEELTRVLFANVSAIRSFNTPEVARAGPVATNPPRVTDLDRLLAAGKIMLFMWLAFLAVIYIPDFPGGMGFLAMCGPFGIILVSAPQMPLSLLFKPVSAGISFAAVLYIFVMPQLSSFTGLGLMIFTATFVICYHYASPQQALGRAFGLAMFVVIISVSNQQSYSFLSVANTALIFPLLFLLISVVTYIPYSSRPERALLQLLRRYFRSAEFLLSAPQTTGSTALATMRERFHRHELATLPAKLDAWAAHADPAVLGEGSVDQLPLLVNSLQALTYRLQELLEVRGLPQAPLLADPLSDDMLAWRGRVIKAFQHLSEDPSAGKAPPRPRLEERLEQLEKRIQECLDKPGSTSLSPTEQQNFYSLLSAYRGTSEALLDFADLAANVDWTPWYEERFA
jgi:uncharacterized membrane protein YccC